MATTTAPGVVISHANGATPTLGSLFDGICFFVLRRVPLRADYIAKIQANGGRIVQLETAAQHIIADHARKDSPPGSLSYTFIDTAIEQGAIPSLDDHRAGPAPGTQRTVGSTIVPAKGTRTPFTAQDDRDLWEWVEKHRRMGGKVKGLEIYKRLEAVNPRHTTQSWRERYMTKLMDRRPEGAQSPELENDQQLEDVQATARPEATAPRPARNENSPRPDAGSPVPTQGLRKRFTLEDDQDLWNWVQKCIRSGKGMVKGNEIYKQLEAVNTRHPWQAWRDRYLKKLIDNPPEGVEGLDHEDGSGADEEWNTGDDFSRAQIQSLLLNAADIERIDPPQLDAAWDAWQENQPEHTAEEWRNFYSTEVRRIYLEILKKHTGQSREEDRESTPTAASSKKESSRRKPTSPRKTKSLENAPATSDLPARPSPSPAYTQKRKRGISSPRAATHGKKRARGTANEIFDHSSSEEAEETPAIKLPARKRPAAPTTGREDSPKAIATETDKLAQAEHEADVAPMNTSSDLQDVLPSFNDQVGHSNVNKVLESDNAVDDSMQVEASMMQGSWPTSEANQAAGQQLAVEDATILHAEAAIDRVTAMAVERLKAMTANRDAFLTSEANRNANEQLIAEAEEPIPDPVIAEVEEAAAAEAVTNMSPERTSLIALTARQLMQSQPDDDADITPPQGNALTEANLASQQAQHKPQLPRGTDLPEDEEEEDQTQYAGYLQKLLGVKGSPRNEVNNFVNHRSEQAAQEAGDVELESDRELTPEPLEGMADLLRSGADGGEPAQSGNNMSDIFTQNLDWPLSPQKMATQQAGSQSYASGTQMQYTSMASQALPSYIAADEPPASHSFEDVEQPPALPSESFMLSTKTASEKPSPKPQAAHASITATATPQDVSAQVKAASPANATKPPRPHSQPRSEHHWTKDEDRAIAQAMRTSSRASDSLAMLDLEGRTLPAIRRRSAVLLKERPRLLSGWDNEDGKSEDDEDPEDVEVIEAAHDWEEEVDFSVPERSEESVPEGKVVRDDKMQNNGREFWTEPEEGFESDEGEVQDERDGMHPAFPELPGGFSTNSADLRDGEDMDDEIDLTVPEPEGGFNFCSQEDAQSAEPSVEGLQEPEPARNESMQQPIEHIEISSDRSSSSDSSDDDEEESYPQRTTRLDPRSLDTQAVLAADSQPLDLSLPLPPDSDSDSEPELPENPVQVPASSTRQPQPSAAPSSTAVPIKSTASSILRQVGSTHRQPHHSTTPNKTPITTRPSPRKVLNSRPQPTPPPPTESVNEFRYRLLARGYPTSSIYSALKRTSMDITLAEFVLIEERQGRSVGGVRGVWTAEEDELVVGGDAAGLRGLWEFHGEERCEERVQFLGAMAGV